MLKQHIRPPQTVNISESGKGKPCFHYRPLHKARPRMANFTDYSKLIDALIYVTADAL